MTDARAFRGFRFPAEVILWAVRWYLQFGISYRDLELPGDRRPARLGALAGPQCALAQIGGVGPRHRPLPRCCHTGELDLSPILSPSEPPRNPL